jgi:hypothetical protein
MDPLIFKSHHEEEEDLDLQSSYIEEPKLVYPEATSNQIPNNNPSMLSKHISSNNVSLKINELASRAFHYIEDRDRYGLFKYLNANANIAIIDYVDTRGYTLLHMACFKNYSDIGIAIILKARESIIGEQLIGWVN